MFTHLHVHTEYSLLDGSSKIKEIAARAKELGMDSLAITDHGVMYGVIDFYRACKAEGIKPIIGCEVYVAPSSRFDRENGAGDERYHHLVLLAENDVGYHNLMKIVSRGFTEGFYYKPRVDKQLLRTYHEGIIALSACLAGEVPRLLTRGMYEEARKAALQMQEIFGEENYFLEIQDHGIPEQKTVAQGILRMSKELEIKMVATNDVHYVKAEDAQAHDVLLCIQTGKKVSDTNRMRYEGGQYYLKSEEEMRSLFPYAPEAFDHTTEIANRCNVEIVFGEQKVPKFTVPEEFHDDSYLYLVHLCQEGIGDRYHTITQELKDRLEYELSVIKNMGYVDYFLIVWDFIHYAKENGIAVGPGRGSAAGSIVSYSLGITDIDPIRYSLLFERFLNPERVSMPDIDVDFCFVRRQEVIDYVVRKYGKEKVTQIVTFGTMAAKAVIRDVGRAMDMPYAEVDRISKMIPNELGITISKALELNHELKGLYENDGRIRELIDTSLSLEGIPRHASMHAAGVVIGQAPIEEYVPLATGNDGAVVTQFTMTTIEQLGLLKMDFLGLRTLTVIQDAVAAIVRRTGEDLDINEIDFTDKEVFDMISSGRCEGVFQLESAGMKSFMKELKPHNIEDIIAGISLYRPGPMDFIPKYIKGKENQADVTYACPELEEILSPTYGCIVYQEQVMQIVMKLAGYTLGRSDLVRRAMSKKKADVMEKERRNFVYGNEKEGVTGCINNGIDKEVALKIFDDMTDFAKYAFNKSHAAAYAVVAYQTAFLKCHYPVEFMAALLTSILGNTTKVSSYIAHCRQMGIEILPPDINEGEGAFSPCDGNIRYGLSAIKSLGEPVIDAIVKERNANGKFKDITDFIQRLSNKEVNKRTIESLIKAGAMDSFGATRKQLMQIYAKVLSEVASEKKNSIAGQMSLMDLLGEEQQQEYRITLPECGEYDKEEMLAFEKEVLGIYASGHPLDEYAKQIHENTSATTVDFMVDSETGETAAVDQRQYVVAGMIEAVTVKITKNRQQMAFVTLEDLLGTLELIVFPRDYEKYKDFLEKDSKVYVRGRASVSDEGGKLIVEKIVPFDQIPTEVWIQTDSISEFKEREEALYELAKVYPGKNPLIIYCKQEKVVNRLSLIYGVRKDQDLLKELFELFGEDNVKIKEKSIENMR